MLTPRMEAILKLLGKNKTVADIGCDHGKLSVYLLKNKIAENVFATDISYPSLEKAKKLAEKEKINNISFFVGDGFSALPKKPDAAVIAGMGGQVIANIIDNKFAKTRLVLQPMKDTNIVYKMLYCLGFYIEKEVIIREGGRFYEIILAIPGNDKPFDYDLPPMDRLQKDENALLFLQHKINVLTKALKGASRSKSQEGLNRYSEINNKIRLLNEVITDAYGKGHNL